jgi:glycine/D-amino acid oxidase-like deaminating enzyme
MTRTDIRVAILGGGLQGCCIALALAERGARVALYDRNAALMSRAAAGNEGKIHLGYAYPGDPGLATARVLAQGAMTFAPFMRRHLGTATQFCTSTPYVYLVHRNSLKSAADISAYLSANHAEVRKAAAGREDGYFGVDLRDPPRPMSPADRKAAFDPHLIVAAFETPEIAIDPLLLADELRSRIAAEPNITACTGRTVMAVEDEGERLRVVSDGPTGGERESYDHVVNALWDGRLKIDAGRGVLPPRQWLYRIKYGIRFRAPIDAPLMPSVTIVNGPFGDIVGFNDGTVYLSWYPACMQGQSMQLAPPEWPPEPAPAPRARLVANTFSALTEIVPALRAIDPDDLPDLAVMGGVIVAWGETDIDDPRSLLHRRYQIGVVSQRHYHSVDPGKYTMAPYFAAICADRIVET